MKALFPGVLILSALVLIGCGRGQVHFIGTPPSVPYYQRLNPEQVELFVGTVAREHTELAWLDSPAVADQTPEAAQEQLMALQKMAARIGAHAVHKIETKRIVAKGFVVDERVPFPAWKQGRYELKFLRGVAIRYTDEQTTHPSTPTVVVRRPISNPDHAALEDMRIPPYSGPERGF
ncbi:MAG: hypothetical protein Kow0059_12810 [Candidatus Sumerlaeia bacterium]